MEYTLGAIHNATAELDDADNHENIRLFQVSKLPAWNDGTAVPPQSIGQVTGSCLYNPNNEPGSEPKI
jgi:hypothetical protein